MFFEPSSVNIGTLKVNNVDHGGNISFGQSLKMNRNVSAKKSQGFGQQHADSVIRFDTIQLLLDEDVLDRTAMKMNR
jgi:hypothetical protein